MLLLKAFEIIFSIDRLEIFNKSVIIFRSGSVYERRREINQKRRSD